jgi:hypothetical protein
MNRDGSNSGEAGENGQRFKGARAMASEGSSANSSSEAAGRSTRKRPHARRADSSAAVAPAARAAVAARTANNAVRSTGGRFGSASPPPPSQRPRSLSPALKDLRSTSPVSQVQRIPCAHLANVSLMCCRLVRVTNKAIMLTPPRPI